MNEKPSSEVMHDWVATMDEVLNRNPDYDGPSEIRPFAEYLAPIGEVVFAFSRVERRLTWAIESALALRVDDANAIEESIMSVATRIGLFYTVAKPHVSDKKQLQRLDGIVTALRQANDYRNLILHGPWIGTQASFREDGSLELAGAIKTKFAQLGAKNQEPRNHSHSVKELRERAVGMLALGVDIQVWILEIFPNAQNRVP